MHYEKAKITPLPSLMHGLGTRIEEYRISRNLKQEDLAGHAGISRSTLARLEAGKGGTIDSLARVLRALSIEDRLLDVVPDARISPLDPRSDAGKVRRRVRQSAKSNPDEKWSWGDEAP